MEIILLQASAPQSNTPSLSNAWYAPATPATAAPADDNEEEGYLVIDIDEGSVAGPPQQVAAPPPPAEQAVQVIGNFSLVYVLRAR